jgi:hypothetical protein
MKKALIPLLLLPLLISCEINQSSSLEVTIEHVNSSDWIAGVDNDGNNLFYYYNIPAPQITQFAYDQGIVNAFCILGESQQMLPYVRHFEDTNLYNWTRTVDFEYTPGLITVYVTRSDFATVRPPAMDFRIVVQW